MPIVNLGGACCGSEPKAGFALAPSVPVIHSELRAQSSELRAELMRCCRGAAEAQRLT